MKKKAFTLTELLVVVVIIGVLSAVVLPKFTKVLQTRKTTEAENIMAAVRNEQEARCMVGRNYVGQDEIDKLASLPKATSKNYTYTLDAQGITATAKDGNYTLQIPSYTDGRICCSGDGCAGLNKDYPECGKIPNLEDATCEAPEEPGPAPRPNPESEPDCDENARPATTQKCTPIGYSTECGEQTRSVKCDASTNYEWQALEWSEVPCQTTSKCQDKGSECSEGARQGSATCNLCGTQTTQVCSNGKWVDEMGTCSVTDTAECCGNTEKPSATRTCGCNGTQTRELSCVQLAGQEFVWLTSLWGECTGEDNSCNICPNTPVDERECTPGESKRDGTNMCRVATASAGNYQEATLTKDVSVSREEDVAINNESSGPDSRLEGHGRPSSSGFTQVDFGYYCAPTCKWKAVSCPSTSGGGGGGGGGIGSVHFTEVSENSYTVVSADPLCTVHVTEDHITGERWATGTCY